MKRAPKTPQFLNVVWLTSRLNCRFEWFCRSLHRECRGNYGGIRVIAVDYWLQPTNNGWSEANVEMRRTEFAGHARNMREFLHVAPKPCPWQGPHRRTKGEYFAASNTRNTGLCFCKDGFIAYVDDISVLMPGWLKQVRRAISHDHIFAGAFRKVLRMQVTVDGKVSAFDDHPGGYDSRWSSQIRKPIVCPPNWLFGASLVAPVAALEKVNGWPELSDSTGIGAEDCMLGQALVNSGHEIRYNPLMLTYESEELHHQGKPLLRVDKGEIGTPNSKSHELVRRLQGLSRFENDFGGYDLAGLRKHIAGGGTFPVPQTPAVDYWDGTPLSEL